MAELPGNLSEAPQPKPQDTLPIDYWADFGGVRFTSTPVLAPFALGAMLLAIAMTPVWGAGALVVGFFFTWGLSAALLIAVKVRGVMVRGSLGGRPWWINLIAGFLNSLSCYLIIMATTARQTYSPMLGDGGTLLLAVLAVAVLAAITAVFITPRFD